MLRKVTRHGFDFWEVQPAPTAMATIPKLMANAPAFQSTGAEPAKETLAPSPSHSANEGSATRTAARAGQSHRPSVLSVPSVPSVVIPKATPAQKPKPAKRGPKPSLPLAASSTEAIARIQAAAMQAFHITPDEFRASSRRPAVWARVASIALCRDRTRLTLTAISAAHVRTPAVATNALASFTDWFNRKPQFAATVHALETALISQPAT